jgi:hypothetical protein
MTGDWSRSHEPAEEADVRGHRTRRVRRQTGDAAPDAYQLGPKENRPSEGQDAARLEDVIRFRSRFMCGLACKRLCKRQVCAGGVRAGYMHVGGICAEDVEAEYGRLLHAGMDGTLRRPRANQNASASYAVLTSSADHEIHS